MIFSTHTDYKEIKRIVKIIRQNGPFTYTFPKSDKLSNFCRRDLSYAKFDRMIVYSKFRSSIVCTFILYL